MTCGNVQRNGTHEANLPAESGDKLVINMRLILDAADPSVSAKAHKTHKIPVVANALLCSLLGPLKQIIGR